MWYTSWHMGALLGLGLGLATTYRNKPRRDGATVWHMGALLGLGLGLGRCCSMRMRVRRVRVLRGASFVPRSSPLRMLASDNYAVHFIT